MLKRSSPIWKALRSNAYFMSYNMVNDDDGESER